MARRRLIEIEPTKSGLIEVKTGGPKKVLNKRLVRRSFSTKGKYRYEKLDIDWLKQIIKAVKLARHRHRISQRQLARLLRTGQLEISKFESGLSNPTAEFINR